MVTCTGHIGIHEVRTDVRMYGRTYVSHIDGLPYFLNYGALRAWSSAINVICVIKGKVILVNKMEE